MSVSSSSSPASFWPLVLSAAAILMITMGARQSLGLFVAPIDGATGLGIATVSLAFAVSQLMWGAAQPVYGALAERWGTRSVIVSGALLVALGTAMTPFARSPLTLTFWIGVVAAAGAAGSSFAILIGGIARHLPEERRAFATGFVNAGSSFGQFLFAPLAQALIAAFGWVSAMLALAASALLTIPLAWYMTRRTPAAPAATHGEFGLGEQLQRALRERSYLLLHLAFFTCGFHIAFLVTHLPGEVALCGLSPAVSASSLALIGLFNIAGSLSAGALSQRYRMKNVLMATYGARAVVIGLYLLAPKTSWTFYVFAAALGYTYLATVLPTAGLIGKLFGPRHLATLFGLTLFTHQIGGFFGAWLGGLTISRFGDYTWMWYAGIVLALAAVICHLPIREARPLAQPVPA
ncbi:MAG TPA: MFS transporter [Gammaproteobacteria bacterium]|nr:MFS transporter [Gammaproteobacteria bacterium]